MIELSLALNVPLDELGRLTDEELSTVVDVLEERRHRG